MGLLNSYTSYNRVISQDKVVRYSRTRIDGSWTYATSVSTSTTLSHVWEYHRICTKQYSYVGMDRETANACAAAMIQKYTRDTRVSVWNESGETAGTFTVESAGSIIMADVAVIHDDGCMYSVQVSVQEDDSRMRVAAVSPETLFTLENARDYDDGEEETNG